MVSCGWCVCLLFLPARRVVSCFDLSWKWSCLLFAFRCFVFVRCVFLTHPMIFILPHPNWLQTFRGWVWVVVGLISDRELDKCTLMHSSLRAQTVAEMAVMNHRPAVIDGVLKEILDRFHFLSLWSAGASWQLHPPSFLLLYKDRNNHSIFQLKRTKSVSCSWNAWCQMINIVHICITDLFALLS